MYTTIEVPDINKELMYTGTESISSVLLDIWEKIKKFFIAVFEFLKNLVKTYITKTVVTTKNSTLHILATEPFIEWMKNSNAQHPYTVVKNTAKVLNTYIINTLDSFNNVSKINNIEALNEEANYLDTLRNTFKKLTDEVVPSSYMDSGYPYKTTRDIDDVQNVLSDLAKVVPNITKLQGLQSTIFKALTDLRVAIQKLDRNKDSAEIEYKNSQLRYFSNFFSMILELGGFMQRACIDIKTFLDKYNEIVDQVNPATGNPSTESLDPPYVTYNRSRANFSIELNKLFEVKYKLALLKELTTNIEEFEEVDPVTLCALESLGVYKRDISKDAPVMGVDVHVALEEVIDSVSEAILKYVGNVTNGFVDLSESFCDYQKQMLATTNKIFNLYSAISSSNSTSKDYIVREDIPEFHDFKVLVQSMLIYTNAVFKDKLQSVVGEENLFGLKSDNNISSYKDILPTEFTSELQTKLGLTYESNIDADKDTDKEESSEEGSNIESKVETLRFHQPFNIPFSAKSTDNKSIERLGYGNIHDLKKFTVTINNVVNSLIKDIPELVDKCKQANTLVKQNLTKEDSNLSEDSAKSIVDTTMIWGNMTESCLRCITFYMRAYQEILNVLYRTVKEQRKD